MARKRGNGEGSITRHKKSGLFMARYWADTPTGHKRKTIYGKTRIEVAERLADAISDRNKGIAFDDGNVTVGEFMTRWLEDSARGDLAHRTYHNYRLQIRRHIVPTLGRKKLAKLSPAHIQALYAQKKRDGLKPASVRYIHAVLHRALQQAMKWGMIPRNPAAVVDPPKVRQKETKPLDARQAELLLTAARDDRYEALYVLCLTAGLRQGEALGLKWRDVDLDAATLRVNRQLQRMRGEDGEPGRLEFSEPKNSSRRTVGLSRRAVRALREHRRRQLEEKLGAGPDWQDQDLVFASARGGPVDAQNVVNRSFKPLLKTAGLPPIRFHDLRHSCLSLLAQRGEPIRDLQALAGHASASFTLQRYTHHYDASASRTARAMDDILPDER